MHRIGALVGSLLLALTPHAAADVEALPPPGDFEATYNEATQELHLQWSNTGDAATYNVYQDGVRVATTTHTNYTIAVDPGTTSANAMHFFYVAAQRDVVEGPPTPPLILLQWPLDEYDPPRCPLIITSFEPDNPPFVHGGIDEACKDAWEWYIQHLLGELTGPMIEPGAMMQAAILSGGG